MKEIQQILKKIASLKPNEKAILATVVDVKGSSYRLPGAKMLILENGDTYGTVSGGCLEADVFERAKKVLETKIAEVFVYDTTKDADSVFSLNMGCRGIIKILLEPIEKESPLLNSWRKCLANDDNQATATLISSDSKNKEIIGGRIYYDKIEQFYYRNLPQFLEKHTPLSDDVYNFFESKQTPLIKHYQTPEGEFEFFFENFSLPINLTIFGAGADAVPLAELSKNLGWKTTVIDHREKFANKRRFSTADKIIISHPTEVFNDITFDENSVVVIMTHNYEHDKNILKGLLNNKKLKYIGKLGPKRRSENMLREFQAEGFTFASESLENFYSPVGLDIGADTPEAIALSIVAEIQAVLKNRQGGFLKHRIGSIYGRE